MLQRHRFHSSVLREYDIRGIVGETLSEADAYAVGRSLASIVVRGGGTKVAAGYDGRLSSPQMLAALVDGLRDAGAAVARIGRGPTPMLYFSTFHLGADAGVMVTGSHNPPDYNGFKVMLGGKAFYGEQVQDLGRLAATGDWLEGAGTAEDVEVRQAYLEELVAAYATETALSVAWDCGNGATGDILPALIDRLPGRHIALNAEVDGTFPAHHPDPTVAENLVQLQQVVAAEGLDCGIGFDGDGDRIGVIDGQGRILWGDQLLAILGRDVLAERPGSTIIADVKASQVLFDEIRRAGGVPLMYRTGHSLIKSKMAETGAPLAGEMSGHIFFADKYYGFDDALYVAVRFLDAVVRSGSSVAELRDSLGQMVNTPEVRFDCDDERKFGVVEEVKAALQDAGAEFSDVDGVRVSTADGWWLLRASNTQPVLVVRCEAADQAGLDRLKAAVTEALAPRGVTPPAGF
ncbi:MAG: phosphomannomutase/phosphoglucomutase [Alphaproteobacteria bacterium]|jgi:phosphomannomutase|nr:phosphomannomutase/phosphoglucomutase [Alphaproteobacteria bacterium]MDP6811761.1 phosphomannomutase/phosphoglucomutase [Alphaproteobacteria bacterium]